MDTVTSNSVTNKLIEVTVKIPERWMQLAKINGSGSGRRRRMKMVVIYQLMFWKLMWLALHFVFIAINVWFTAM